MIQYLYALRIVAEYFKISSDELIKGRRRFRKINEIRYCIYIILNKTYGLSVSSIARAFGKDRTSIRNGIKYIEFNLKYDETLVEKFNIISELIFMNRNKYE